ncbi:MAG: GGDEF domain-containing protein [Pseudomonadales bacterium]|nr:GGDEF domain-containing protein [Pseudomonadales bacterium]
MTGTGQQLSSSPGAAKALETEADSVYAEQVRITDSQTTTAAASIPPGAAIYAWMLWSQVDRTELVIWWTLAVGLVAIRMFAHWRFLRAPMAPGIVHRWGRFFVLVAGLQGAIFGVGFAYFTWQSEPLYVTISVIWMLGISAVSIGAYSADPKVLLSYFLPVAVPEAIVLLWMATPMSIGMGVALILYIAVILRSMIRVSRAMVDAITLNFRLEQEIEARKRAEQRLLVISQQDGLTGLANRRHLDEVLARETSRARRSGQPLSLILIDLDAFKRFNDTYGHLDGDECLRRVSGVLKETVKRPGDLAARYGGEELACVLPETDADDAYALAETIRKRVLALHIPHSARIDGEKFVTISAGVAGFEPARDTDTSDFVRRADEALYAAKESGRNRVVRAPAG